MLSYRELLSRKEYLSAALLSIVTFGASVGVTWYAARYATAIASNPVTDIILSNTRTYDLGTVFVWGTVLLLAYITVILLADPKRLPFTLYALALFFLIRALFFSLTHIAPYPDHVTDIGETAAKLFLGADLFFSGHTGAPFLLALIFWRERVFRYTFLLISLGFAVVVLLSHLHYSIDVLAAFFISYSIFHLAELLFPLERRLYFEGPAALEKRS